MSISSGFNGLGTAERDSARVLQAISSMPPPGNMVWGGTDDQRTARRYLNACGSFAVANGLDHEGLVKYFMNRCISASFAEELSMEIYDVINHQPVDYLAVSTRIEEYFLKRYASNNDAGRVMDVLEEGQWAKNSSSLELFIRSFKMTVKDCELVGISLDRSQQRRYLLKYLPEPLRKYALEACPLDLPVDDLFARLAQYSMARREDFFRAPIRTNVIERRDPPRADRAPIRCFLCQEQGHVRRDCPFLGILASEQQKKVAGAERRADDPPSTENTENSGGLRWSCGVVQVNRVTNEARQNMTQVVIVSQSAVNSVEIAAMVDSGSDVTLMSRKLADGLFRSGAVVEADVDYSSSLRCRFADNTEGKDLGSIKVVIHGVPVKVFVLPSLQPECILGLDSISAIPELQRFLIDRFCPLIAGAPDDRFCPLSAAASAEPHPEGMHADWPAISFQWKTDARPASNVQFAVRDAMRLEQRLARSGLLDPYKEVLETWARNGWLIETAPSEAKHCFRHFGVVKEGTTQMSKCRVVIDGSAMDRFIDPGTCTHRDQVFNLIAWRFATGFASVDISSAYMRLRISPSDSYFMCIAWQNKIFRFTSLPMGVNCSASSLQRCIDEYLQMFAQEAGLPSNVHVLPYMDDLLMLFYGEVSPAEEERWRDVRRIGGPPGGLG
jgi:hypothetical protein